MNRIVKILRENEKLATGRYIRCWSCEEVISLKSRANADGDCPKCRAEIDLPANSENHEVKR